MRIHSMQPEYNLAMGECKMQLGEFKEAIQYFSNVVRIRPRNISSWEALIRCLYTAEFFDEALEQVECGDPDYGREADLPVLSGGDTFCARPDEGRADPAGECDVEGTPATEEIIGAEPSYSAISTGSGYRGPVQKEQIHLTDAGLFPTFAA